MRHFVGNAWGHYWVRVVGLLGLLALLLAAVVTAVGIPKHAARAATGYWSMYLGDLGRSGFNPSETIITPGTAKNLKLHWTRSAGSSMATEPVEANGLIYWGTWDGLEHATDPSTGNDVWTANLGQTSSCTKHPHGVLSTATVASMTIAGVATTVVYVGGGNAQLYALDANAGTVLWQTPLGSPPNDFIYSSPAIYNGSVYIGVSSYNDCPLVQGRMVQMDASTGIIQHIFTTVPDGCIGGGVWGSPTIDTTTGMLYFSTGTPGTCSTSEPLIYAVVALNAADLSFVGAWQVPPADQGFDSDFGTTPTLFQATIGGVLHQMLGLANKNGIYYAFNRADISAGPLWQVRIAAPGADPARGHGSISSSAWDGTALYVAGADTTINNLACGGSVRALDPTTGVFLWERCLGKNVLAAVTSVPGLVIADAGANMIVVNATTGKKLFTYHDPTTGSGFWGAASVSNGVLYQGNMDGKLYAFGL